MRGKKALVAIPAVALTTAALGFGAVGTASAGHNSTVAISAVTASQPAAIPNGACVAIPNVINPKGGSFRNGSAMLDNRSVTIRGFVMGSVNNKLQPAVAVTYTVTWANGSTSSVTRQYTQSTSDTVKLRTSNKGGAKKVKVTVTNGKTARSVTVTH